MKLGLKKVSIGGGLWQTKSLDTEDQEYILLNKLYSLMLSISNSTTNITLINFPLLTKDPKYLYQKLNPVSKDITYDVFLKVFKRTVKPEFVNQFNNYDG